VWITSDVELPAELVEAHAENKLVFFVGAGASMGDPSNLPSFKDLARALAKAAHVPFDSKMALDLFLGTMPPDFETHAHTQRLIARPDSRFNPTHSAVVRLASAYGQPRIVTTNFDNHLASASISAQLPETDVWVGPALPLGDDFTGIVHLHGSVLRPPEQLVLTDRNFGRAYLTDAWATRFLQKMFDEFTVVFVGYSHDDPIMRYLALGLPSRTHRYVITEHPDDEKWDHLGIVPISYPAPDEDHSGLVSALEEWDRRARMGRLDHQARMKEIIEAGLPLNPVDQDYVHDRLQRMEGVIEFARFAKTVEWLQWIEGVQGFKNLFSGIETEETSVLARWLGQVFLADPALHGAALQVVQRLGQRLSPSLFRSLSWAAETLTTMDSEAGRRWKVLLATSIDGISAPPILETLLPYEPGDKAETLALIRVALRSFLVLKPNWSSGRDATTPPRAEPTWHTDAEVLSEHTNRLVQDSAPADPALGTLLEDALGNAYDLLTQYNGEQGYDSLSSHRSAIERHPQDEFREPIDALIDALRDYGSRSITEYPDLPHRWWARGSRLFQRLALHLIELSPQYSANEKLEWILQRNLLFESSQKHEVFRVLAAAIAGATPEVLARLLESALNGPALPDDIPDIERHTTYSVYNLLVWITRASPSWVEARRELERIQSTNPDFAPRDFPDLDSWSSGVTWGESLPMEVESFVQDLANSPEAALTRLLEVDYSERRIDGPTWRSALTLVNQATARRPELGLQLWNAISLRPGLGLKFDQLQDAIIEGWERADLEEYLSDVLDHLAERVDASSSTRGITRLLVTQIEKHLDIPESSQISNMRNLARSVWRLHSGSFEIHSGSEPSFLALNSWPGDLARYWTLEVNRRWRELGEHWNGFNQVERDSFESLLAAPDAELKAIRPAIAGEAYFLFAADSSFTQRNILPLFDGPNAWQAWNAYLYGPRYNDAMLGAGFFRSVLDEWDHLDDLGERGLQTQFLGLTASIVCTASITHDQRQELLAASVLADGGKYAPKFAVSILRMLQDDSIDGSEMWELWLRDHLAERFQGLPRTARPTELERWADVAPFVGTHSGEAFALLSGRGIGLGENYHAPEWPIDLLADQGPELVSHLAERIRNTTPFGRITPFAVRETIEDLTEVLGETVCEPLLSAASDAGFVTREPSDRAT